MKNEELTVGAVVLVTGSGPLDGSPDNVMTCESRRGVLICLPHQGEFKVDFAPCESSVRESFWINGSDFSLTPTGDVRYSPVMPTYSRHSIKCSLTARDGRQCQYCGAFKRESWLSIDHVIPISKGGCNCLDNLKLCCRSCNSRKGERTLEKFRLDHFLSKSPYAKIITSRQAEELIRAGASLPGYSPGLFVFEEERK
jgi:hypothetical protein